MVAAPGLGSLISVRGSPCRQTNGRLLSKVSEGLEPVPRSCVPRSQFSGRCVTQAHGQELSTAVPEWPGVPAPAAAGAPPIGCLSGRHLRARNPALKRPAMPSDLDLADFELSISSSLSWTTVVQPLVLQAKNRP